MLSGAVRHRGAGPAVPKMLLMAIAYRLQETSFGGLKPATRKRLQRIAQGSESAGEGPRSLKPGTTLVRQWHGETYELWVLETGYAWRGEMRHRGIMGSRLASIVSRPCQGVLTANQFLTLGVHRGHRSTPIPRR